MRSARRRGTRSGGFSLIEMLIVMVVVLILGAIALPELQNAVARARAAKALADVNTIRLAAHEALTKNGAFPPQANFGVVPPKMVPYLPANFSFKKGPLQYRWRLFSAKASPFGVQSGRVVIQLTKGDRRFLDALASMGNSEMMLVQSDRVHVWVLP